MKPGEKKANKIIDRGVDFLFSKDPRRWLILIFILGLILRIIVASNLTPVEDESGSITHAIGFSKLAPLSQMAQAQIWYYLTDFSFRIFGVSLLTGRLLSVIFGSLSIILVYLLASQIFNKKTGLIAAFILAISAYHITWTASYQDQTMMFFVLLASFFFIKEYRKSGKISILSGVFLGIAELVKIITGVFVVVFGFFSLWILYNNYRKDRKLFRINLKRGVIIVIILLVCLLPILGYNYFLYKEKGIVDLPFAQFLRINPEFYTSPGLHHEEGFVPGKLIKNLYTVATLYFLKEDTLIFILAVLGIISLLISGRKMGFENAFFLVMFFFALVFIASAIVLQTHYTSFFPLMAIFASGLIWKVSDKERLKKNSRWIIIGVLVILLIFTLWNLREPLTSKSALDKMRNYAEESIDENTLVIVDARIYTGTYSWMFHDKSYINAGYFSQIIETSINYPGQKYPIRTVFVECVNDDCGWGTIKDQPELNQTMEELVAQFKGASSQVTEIQGGGSITGVRGGEERGVAFYKVYETSLNLPPEILQSVKQTHNHFFYHVPRNENADQAFDHYTVNGFIDNLLNVVAYIVLYILLILAAISIFVPFYLLIRQG